MSNKKKRRKGCNSRTVELRVPVPQEYVLGMTAAKLLGLVETEFQEDFAAHLFNSINHIIAKRGGEIQKNEELALQYLAQFVEFGRMRYGLMHIMPNPLTEAMLETIDLIDSWQMKQRMIAEVNSEENASANPRRM